MFRLLLRHEGPSSASGVATRVVRMLRPFSPDASDFLGGAHGASVKGELRQVYVA
jgi:hypothetical protein